MHRKVIAIFSDFNLSLFSVTSPEIFGNFNFIPNIIHSFLTNCSYLFILSHVINETSTRCMNDISVKLPTQRQKQQAKNLWASELSSLQNSTKKIPNCEA